MKGLSELATHERPRERLLQQGPSALSGPELVALVLGTGRGSGEDALQLAHRLLGEVGGLRGLARADLARLRAVTGVGPVKASRLLAAFELCGRGGVAPPVPAGALAASPAEADLPERLADRLRGQVPDGERAVLGLCPGRDDEPATLALGEGIGPQTRPGALLARLLSLGPGPWWVAVLRPGGAPSRKERDAARRIVAAATLVGVGLEQVLVVGSRGHWTLGGSEP